jgi:undecaprenyl-diphosphatase
LTKIDFLIFQHINSWAGKNHLLDQVVIFCAVYLIWVLIAALLIYFLWYRRDIKVIGASLVTFIFGRLIFAEIIQLLFYRARPFIAHSVTQLVPKNVAASFPSGHTASIVAMGAGIYPYYKKTGITIMILGILVGFARVVAGLHYPGDVLGGIVVGLVAGLFVQKFFRNKLELIT